MKSVTEKSTGRETTVQSSDDQSYSNNNNSVPRHGKSRTGGKQKEPQPPNRNSLRQKIANNDKWVAVLIDPFVLPRRFAFPPPARLNPDAILPPELTLCDSDLAGTTHA